MPTCSQKRKCAQNKTKYHRLPFTPRPCIDSHRIPDYNPHFRSPTCHNPFVHSQLQNTAHCMASVKKCHDEDESENEESKENVQIAKCPFTSSSQEKIKLKSCCVPNVDSKCQDQILPPGFKAHISVDISSDPQSSSAQRPEICCHTKSLENVSNQEQPDESSTPRSIQQDKKSPCCAKSKRTSQSEIFKSSQGIKHSDSIPLIKNIDREILSEQSIESINVSEKPCCASAYPRVKQEPILPPKGISGTARPGYIVNKEIPALIAEEIPSECMTDGGCIHGISSIMPNEKQNRETSCFCGAKGKKDSHVCGASKSMTGQTNCPCRYPPGFSQFSCAGNITGVCKCTGEFK